MSSSDGKTRDLVSTIPGAGWDFSLSRHPYHEYDKQAEIARGKRVDISSRNTP